MFNRTIIVAVFFIALWQIVVFGNSTGLISADSIINAGNYTAMEGVKLEDGGIGWLDDGDWVKYENIEFTEDYTFLRLNIACDDGYEGGEIEIRLENPDGPLVGVHTVKGTGGWHIYKEQMCRVSVTAGVKDIYIVGRKRNGIGNIEWFTFENPELNNDGNPEWILIWGDEFDYTGTPDRTRWDFDIGTGADRGLVGWGNNELQYYTDNPGNIFVDNGVLTITARKEIYEDMNYTSSRIITKNIGDWQYGKIEIRAKLPEGRGTWPAIWMLPTEWRYGNWPDSGEIDIMEHVGFDQGRVHGTVHTKAFNHMIGTQKGDSLYQPDVSHAFHIYSIEWLEDRIDFYLDDFKYFTFEKVGTSFAEWPFDQPFHLLMNIAVGGGWGGAQGVADDIWPQSMIVDYVRVYQYNIDQNDGNSSTDNSSSNNNDNSNSDISGSSGYGIQTTVTENYRYEFGAASLSEIGAKFESYTDVDWVDLQIRKNDGGIIGYRMEKSANIHIATVGGFKQSDILDYRFLYQDDSKGQIVKNWHTGYVFGDDVNSDYGSSDVTDDTGNANNNSNAVAAILFKNNAPFSIYAVISWTTLADGEIFHDPLKIDSNSALTYDLLDKEVGTSGRCYLFYDNHNRVKGEQKQPNFTEPFQLLEFNWQDGFWNYNISCVDGVGLPVSMSAGNTNIGMLISLAEYKLKAKNESPTIILPQNKNINEVNSYKVLSSYNFAALYVLTGKVADNGVLSNYINYYNQHYNDTENPYMETLKKVFYEGIDRSKIVHWLYGGTHNSTDYAYMDHVAALQRGVSYIDRENSNLYYKTEYSYNKYAKFIHKTLNIPVYAFANDDHQNQGGFRRAEGKVLTIAACPADTNNEVDQISNDDNESSDATENSNIGIQVTVTENYSYEFGAASLSEIDAKFESYTDADWVDLQIKKNDGGIIGYRMGKSANIHIATVGDFNQGDVLEYRFLYQDDSKGQIVENWHTGYVFGNESDSIFDNTENSDGNNNSDSNPAVNESNSDEEGKSIDQNIADNILIKFMSYNIFYANIGAEWRIDGVSQTIADYSPDIASLQEMWGERWRILERVRLKTGLDYALATGGEQEKYWDGDILYRQDIWSIVEDGVLPYDGSRGMTWAVMNHKITGRKLLVYGIHPLAGVSEEMHLKNMEMATEHMRLRPEYPEAGVVFMGDFNSGETGESMKLLREGDINAYGRGWNIPIIFEDSFRLINGSSADGDTGFGVKIDYIYTEKRLSKVFEIKKSFIRRDAPGGSDHHPIMAELQYIVAVAK
ncbi:MAG TPA: family 16 glycosylhydrolase [Victivallales bacterium]|nr:family 16 glycosylhydrolase [Victivallales bacterium]|tara:strand:- start:1546 stop:5367 length:3822 start_codon:yes stop_codon:yes gene_type:complete